MLHEIYTSICILAFLYHNLKCSEVYDRTNDNTLYISDYCPAFPKCLEGTHILCAIYSPDRPKHTFCDNSHNVSITAEMANKVLAYINIMRSRIAKGVETGKDKVKLPRGYGIPRVQWDPELALFAQIHANKCTLRSTICVATLKFDKPLHTTITTRFHEPNWDLFQKPYHKLNKEKGLNNAKLFYAISIYYNEIYRLRNLITPDMINDSKKADKIEYISIINSKMTHVGCGISVFKTLVEEKSIKEYTNHVTVSCIFSCYPKNEVYNTTDPRGNDEFTKDCGCPSPHKEDDDCLCNVVPLKFKTQGNETHSIGDPQLIVLPIISIQNAPKEKLVSNLKTHDKSIRRRPVIQEQLIRNQFVPIEHRFEEVGYIKKDVVPRRDFVKVRKLTEIYTKNYKNRRYLNYKEPQDDNRSLYSTGRDGSYHLTEKNDFNDQKKDIINEQFKFQILTLLKNLEKVAANVRFKSSRKALILNKIHNIFNMLVDKNDRDKANEGIDRHYSVNLGSQVDKSISSRPMLNSEKMSQRNTVYEKADAGTHYFTRNKTIDIFNRYDYANNDNIYGNFNNRHDMHRYHKTIQSVKSDRQIRPLKQEIQKNTSSVPRAQEKKHQFYIPDRSTRL